MIPELQEVIHNVQLNLYRGFVSSKRSGIVWLNSVCGDLYKLFRILHKFLVFEGCNNVSVMEITCLCLSQIVVCIRCLERTLAIEQENQCALTASRQCFLDRIIWCVAKIKIVTEDGKSAERESTTESNFVSFLDLALSLVGPLAVSFEDGLTNHAEQDADSMMESMKIRSVVEALITQTLSFGNVLQEEERAQLMLVCQKVLKECIALEKEAMFIEGENRPNAQNRRLRASVLESAFFQLETQVNDCLLRLVFETFAELDRKLISKIRKLVTEKANEEEISGATTKFDETVDKMMQIGLFAISYADNYKAASTIRSCLASIEALDSYLVPSIFIPCNLHSKLLEDHWLEELSLLRYHVQRIIDSNAFALALLEILDNGIDSLKLTFNTSDATILVRKSEVFRQHLEYNSVDLGLNKEPLKIHYEDFKMMVYECKAILKCFKDDPEITVDRILKRIRIMRAKLSKVQQTISAGKNKEAAKENLQQVSVAEVARTDEEKEVDRSVREFFSNSVLRPSMTSILYRSRRGPRSRQGSIASLATMQRFSDVTAGVRQRAVTTPEKGSGRSGRQNKLLKRNSLRVAIFKKQHGKQDAEFFDSYKSDIDFQITEILDQLTDLSTTFSSSQETQIEATESSHDGIDEKETAPTTRKSITKEEIVILDDNRISINITTDI
ncbi:serendipity locus protein alpha-like [Topomyia yanbarensis]|uniref:serendipity locus protein alpha-like n=1 Tax=Topomyia yanbarensis TaxID=2498891 RepID=UPI00273AC84A|nr:serendipity locus protein alpha-like [Topomyia yanbarensis]